MSGGHATAGTQADSRAAWDVLNDRQRAYLALAYTLDQEHEAAERGAWARGGRRRPADAWRWLDYGHVHGGPSALLTRAGLRGLADAGAGATWQALRRRDLLACRYRPHARGDPSLQVRLTPRGRRVARAGLGEAPPQRLPPGTLREWHWRALTLAYAAGDAGVAKDLADRYGGLGWATWRRLRDYQAGALVEERQVGWEERLSHSAPVYRLFLTDGGRRFYTDRRDEYRRRYPAVDAPAGEGRS